MVADLSPSAQQVLAKVRANGPELNRRAVEDIQAQIETHTIMPGNTRSDYIIAAALCLHLAERMEPQ